MPTKYQCKVCSRSFVHKETLKEHKLLHGLVILDANKFSCPICQHEVTCQSGLHPHGKKYCSTSVQAAECYQPEGNNEAVLENYVNVHRDSTGEGIKLRLKNKNSRWKETAEADITDTSNSVSCKICKRSFVYQKCLQKHTALVHGLSSEDKPKVKMKPDDLHAESLSLPHHAEGHADHQQPMASESYNNVSDICNATKSVPGVGANSLLDSTKDCASKTCAEMTVEEIRKSAELKVDASALKCKTCLKQFKHKAMLLRHMHMIHGEIDFERCTCPLCSQKFSSQWTFSKHFDAEHKTNAAEIIASVAGEQSQTSASDGTSDSGSITRCERCSHWFTCWKSFQKHCSLKHRNDVISIHGDERHRKSVDSEPTNTDHKDKKPFADRTTCDNQKLLRSTNRNAEVSCSGLSPGKTVRVVSEDNSQKSSKYFCSICSKTFVSVNFLDRHIRVKHGSSSRESVDSSGKLECKTYKQTFVCGYCSEEFNKEDALTEHVESCHKGLVVDSVECACPVCGCICPNQMMFSVHYIAAHYTDSALREPTTSVECEPGNSQVCRCKVCELWFTSDDMLRAHHCTKLTPVRQPPKTGRARYRCMQCGEAFEILRRFLHHRKVKHRVVGPEKAAAEPTTDLPTTDLSSHPVADAVNELNGTASQCIRGRPVRGSDVQVKQDSDDESLNEHQDITGSSLPEGAGLSCPECSRVFTTVAQLRRHRKSEHRNRTCQLCGETCKSADMVYYHNLKYHHEQKCEVCGASCSGRLGLIDHFRAHHPTEPAPLINRKTLICEYCPRVFAGCASRLLRDHIESCHLGRVHLCDVCGKRLGSAQTLAVHRRMHDPVARFECRECNRRFPHNTNLMNHIRKHHPERLPAKYVREFRCEVCSMQFGSSSGLSRHRSEKHGTQRFQCDLCLRVFPSVTGLRVHKRRDHQPKETSSAPVPPSTVASAETMLTAPPAPQVVAQFSADPTNAIMAGFMANMIGLPGLGQTFQ